MVVSMSGYASVLRRSLGLALLIAAGSPGAGLAESGPRDASCFDALREILACESSSSDEERRQCVSEQLSAWGGSLTIEGDLQKGCKLPSRALTAAAPMQPSENKTGTSQSLAVTSPEQISSQDIPQAASEPPTQSTPPVEPQTSDAESFGAASLPRSKQKKPPKSVVLVLKEFGIAANKKPFFIFENGQRWQQKSSEDGRLLKLDSLIGEEFTLRRGLLGNYKMSPNSAGRSIKVYRVR